MVFCKVCSGYNFLIHAAIAVFTVVILLQNMSIYEVGEVVFFSTLVVSVLIPFIVHAVYILGTQIGYAVFHEDSVDIVTGFKTYSFPDNIYMFMELKSHMSRHSKAPMFYDVRMDFKLDNKVVVVKLVTNQLYCIDGLRKRFPEPQ